MYKRDNEKDYVVIVNEAVRGQNQLFEKVIIDSQNLAVHFSFGLFVCGLRSPYI